MGEARDRQLALVRGQPFGPDLHRCPICFSRRTVVDQAPAIALSHVPTLMALCADCGAVWEAFPPGWSHDVVEGEPCDNCAFRQGSPESQDKAAWRSMLAKLRHGGQEFRCHKGAPILITEATDDHLASAEFDEPWVQRHGRTCAGFYRVMRQWPDWLDNRYRGAHVVTTFDQDRLLSVDRVDLSDLDGDLEGEDQ